MKIGSTLMNAIVALITLACAAMVFRFGLDVSGGHTDVAVVITACYIAAIGGGYLCAVRQRRRTSRRGAKR